MKGIIINMLKRTIYFLLIAAIALPISLLNAVGAEKVLAAESADYTVISEIQIAGGTTDDEFVELYNPTAIPVTMTDWRLSRKTAGGTASVLVSSLNGIIPAYGFFLITHPAGYDGTVTADASYSTSEKIANDNTVLLYSDAGTTLVDKVGMGTAGDFEGTATANPSANDSIERNPGTTYPNQGNGIDTDNNSSDFTARTVSEPQNIASLTEDPNAPATPTNVNAVDTPNDDGGSMTLTWTKSADDGAGDDSVTGYGIYRSEVSGTYGGSIAQVGQAVTTYEDASATTGTSYFYKIEALDGAYSSFSSEVGPALSVDNLAPRVTNKTPEDGSATDNLRPVISAAFTDGSGIDIANTTVKLDDIIDIPFDANGFSYQPTVDLSGGIHTVRVVIRDQATPANEDTITWSFIVSVTPLDSEITNDDTHTRESKIDLWVKTSNNATGLKIYYNRNGIGWRQYGNVWAVANPDVRTLVVFNSKDALGDGDYGFYSVALDANDNEEGAPLSPDLQITIDTNPPAVPVGYMVPGSPSMDNTPTAMGEISSDTYRVWLEITSHATGEKIIVNGSLIDNKRYEATPNAEQVLADGAYQIIAFAEDRLGNGSMYVIATDFVIDTSNAEVPVIAEAISSPGAIYLNWNKIEGSGNYMMKYRKSGEEFGEPVLILGQNNTEIVGLEEGAEYEFAIASIDQAGNISEYASVKAVIGTGGIVTTVAPTAQEGYPSGGPDVIAVGPTTVASKETKSKTVKSDEQAEAEGIKTEEGNEESEPAEITPIQPEEDEQGQIKAESEEAGTTRNWTRIIVAVSILIIAIGVGTGGWYGYQWWVERGKSEDKSKDVSDKDGNGNQDKKNQGGRW